MQQVLLKSSDKHTLNLYLAFLKLVLKKLSIQNFSILKLPTKKKIITFLKSPHVNKKAQEHFQLNIHKVFIQCENQDLLLKYLLINKPKNITIKFKKRIV